MKLAFFRADNQFQLLVSYSKVENYTPEESKKLEDHYKEVIGLLGEDTDREGLLKTPERVSRAVQYITQGYGLDPIEIIKYMLILKSSIRDSSKVDIKIANNPIRMVCFFSPLKSTSEICPPKGLEMIPDRG